MEEGADPPEGRIGKDDEIAEMLNTQAREREDRKAKKRKKEADREDKFKARMKNKENKLERLEMAIEEFKESEQQLRELQDQFRGAFVSEQQRLALLRQIERDGDYLATVSIYRR